jgi:hypothetical protein
MTLLTGPIYADESRATVTSKQVVAEDVQGFSLKSPMETAVTAFYFPSDKTIAGGIAETVLRAKWTDTDFPTLSKITVDLDVNIAKEVNENKDTLYGPGLKVNYDVDMVNDTGFTFKPSIGLTALRNIEGLNTASDILKNWRLAIYGNIVLYKF